MYDRVQRLNAKIDEHYNTGLVISLFFCDFIFLDHAIEFEPSKWRREVIMVVVG